MTGRADPAPVPVPEQRAVTPQPNRVDPDSPGYRLALATTNMRLAIDEAAHALRTGHPDVALAVLERVAAPGPHPSSRQKR